MTSKHGMRIACGLGLVALLLTLPGCYTDQATGLEAPYRGRHVWAVAPLRNESGTAAADGFKLADTLARRLETVQGIEVLPVNRVLAAMDRLQIQAITSREQAMEVMQTIGADGFVLGNITAYDPYEPPKLGLSLELYTTLPRWQTPLDVRQLTKAATGQSAQPANRQASQPASSVSAVYDASDPAVSQQLEAYAKRHTEAQSSAGAVRLFRISMARYSEFASHAVIKRLLHAERTRIARQRKRRAKARAQAKADPPADAPGRQTSQSP